MTWDSDPRPDLADDSDQWRRLIVLAARYGSGPQSLAAALDGVRCMGARLVIVADRWRIVAGPEYGPAAYHCDRAGYLLPHKEALLAVLGELAELAEVAA